MRDNYNCYLLCITNLLTESLPAHQKYAEKQKDADSYKLAWIASILKGDRSRGTLSPCISPYAACFTTKSRLKL